MTDELWDVLGGCQHATPCLEPNSSVNAWQPIISSTPSDKSINFNVRNISYRKRTDKLLTGVWRRVSYTRLGQAGAGKARGDAGVTLNNAKDG